MQDRGEREKKESAELLVWTVRFGLHFATATHDGIKFTMARCHGFPEATVILFDIDRLMVDIVQSNIRANPSFALCHNRPPRGT